jgi:hypothetical protein
MASPFIGEEEARGYMVSRAKMDGDIGVDANQLEAAIVVWLDKSYSIVLGDDESVLPMYVMTWPMVDKRLVLICVHTYSAYITLGVIGALTGLVGSLLEKRPMASRTG